MNRRTYNTGQFLCNFNPSNVSIGQIAGVHYKVHVEGGRYAIHFIKFPLIPI